MSQRVRVAILGAGCAGLSLAARLGELGVEGVTVLEGRTELGRDRTWCGWSEAPHAFSDCVDRRWKRWTISAPERVIVHGPSEVAYEHIRSDVFSAEARRRAEEHGVQVLTGHVVLDVEDAADLKQPARVTFRGGEIEADLVVDTRPTPPRSGALLQHFMGWEVVTERHAFDPETATLMDFDVPQERGIHFMYVLPFTSTRALVEPTFISHEVLPRAHYEERMKEYLSSRFGAEVERVAYSEHGVIPMDARPVTPRRGVRVVDHGTRAGASRPSTGYAFHAILRSSNALAADIANGRLDMGVRADSGFRRSEIDRWLDSVFLEFLAQHPERAPEVFARAAHGLEASVFVRFMSERSNAKDRLRLIQCMPKLPFLAAALSARSA